MAFLADDLVGAHQLEPLDDVEADTTEAEDHRVGARLHLGGVDDRADARRHAAADVADLLEGRVLADLGHGDLGEHRVVGERARAHVVEHRLAADLEAAGAVGHQPLALRRPDGLAEVGLPGRAVAALATLGRVQRDDVVALFERTDARPHVDDHAGPLVAEDGGEEPLRVSAAERERVGVADPRRLDLDHHLALLGALDLDLLDAEGLSCGGSDGGAGLHRCSPGVGVNRGDGPSRAARGSSPIGSRDRLDQGMGRWRPSWSVSSRCPC